MAPRDICSAKGPAWNNGNAMLARHGGSDLAKDKIPKTGLASMRAAAKNPNKLRVIR